MRRTTQHLLLLGGIAIVLSAAGCHVHARKWVEETRVIELSAADLEKVVAVTDNGWVKVRAADDDETILVTAVVRAGAETAEEAEEALDAIEIVTPTTDGDHKQHIGWEWAERREHDWNAVVSFEIAVPKQLALEVESQNGALDVDGLTGSCELTTQNGEIKCKQRAASADAILRAHTQNGAVYLSSDASNVEAQTENGRLEARTSAGRVRLNTTNGAVTAWLMTAGPIDGEIETENGRCEVLVGDNLDARLSCQSQNGGIRNRLADGPRERVGGGRGRRLQATLGKGVGRLDIETENGSITILPLSDDRNTDDEHRDVWRDERADNEV